MARKDDPSAQIDRLSTLPAELRSRIYLFVFFSGGQPPTLHVRHRLHRRAQHASLLRLLWSSEYRQSKFYHSTPEWSDHVEAAFIKALEINLDGREEKLMGLVIHELTGVVRCESQLLSHIDAHKVALKLFFPITQHYIPEINESLYQYQDETSDPLEDIDTMVDWIKTLQVKLSDQLGAYNQRSNEHGRRLEHPLKRGRECLDFPAVTPNAEVFSRLSEVASSTAIHCKYPLRSLLSITLVSHEVRAEALAVLASTMLYEFKSADVLSSYKHLDTLTFQKIRHVRVTFIEGFMGYPMSRPRAHFQGLDPQDPDMCTQSDGSWDTNGQEGKEGTPDEFFTLLNEYLPNVSTLHIDVWPRRIHEGEEVDKPWGRDTERLLESLGKARLKARTILEWRWQHDCERFERERMDSQGWICLGSSGHITEETSTLP